MAFSDRQRPFHFAIDRGGTFTDIYARVPPLHAHDPGYRVLKLLSDNPEHYDDAPAEGIRRILTQETGKTYNAQSTIDTTQIGSIRMGTTVATNALLERQGERVAFACTRGFRDLLRIGTQARPRIFDLAIQRPQPLEEAIVEIDERVRVVSEHGNSNASQQEDEIGFLQREAEKEGHGADFSIGTGISNERVLILKRPNEQQVRQQLQTVYDSGIRSLAVAFLHSYTYQEHELLIGRIARSIGFTHVSLSSELMAMFKIVPRGFTATADAYLTPAIHRYLHHFLQAFDDGIHKHVKLAFMQSDGGLATVAQFNGYRAVLSGPAGGVVGYASTTRIADTQYNDGRVLPVIGFDVGGTSTDVSRFDGHEFEHIFENTVAGVTIMAPQLDINTVAAGGGSILFFRNGMLVVGPDSAAANPGPACYRRGGPLTITDANLFLGRLLPEHFPSIFGPNSDQPLDVDVTKRMFDDLTNEINAFFIMRKHKKRMTSEEVALGFLDVATESTCRPIRALTSSRGFDVTRHVLSSFGGAGGQLASAVAKNLGIRTIFIHKFAGILSAYGIGLSDIVHETQEPCAKVYSSDALPFIRQRISALSKQAKQALYEQSFSDADITLKVYLNMRYNGTDTALMTSTAIGIDDYSAEFLKQYKREFGFTLDREIIVDDIRIRAVGRVAAIPLNEISTSKNEPQPIKHVCVYFTDGWRDTAVYILNDLGRGDCLEGPAIIIDQTSTIVVEPGCSAKITKDGSVLIKVGMEEQKRVDTSLDAVQLSIFGHRFMSIAEQMGRVLQRTSVSTNIKERLDFSCALFSPDGGLVANAPHLPVHLGSMQEAVRFQTGYLGDSWNEGDVILTNHPQAGGTHLPDCTVISPVFKNGKKVFFVASRGHHSDIGGIQAGSMPPASHYLIEEGAAIMSFKIVQNSKFDEEGVSKLMMAPGQLKSLPGEPKCYGSRNLKDNISDFKAQVAANQHGIRLVSELIEEYGLDVVHAYMAHIQTAAETAVREMLREISLKHGLQEVDTVHSVDYMDDGAAIQLALTIDRREGSAVFNFAGTSPEVYGNTNAPAAVTYSAIIYCLRCLVKREIPLNQGCLKPITVFIPDGCMLNPSEGAAVVGGNVLTSQRVTDVVLKAFRACAASQGCMNNTTFGDDTFGYYETVAGGAGAGPGWHGTSGVHTHMTNTRITDVEIMERRYPVLVRQFRLRNDSGGSGLYKGGEGVVRELEFLRPLTVGILSERRVHRPYGMNGGGPGEVGQNLIITAEGKQLLLGPKNTYKGKAGDRLLLLTPGGGGYGCSDDVLEPNSDQRDRLSVLIRSKDHTTIGSLAARDALQHGA